MRAALCFVAASFAAVAAVAGVAGVAAEGITLPAETATLAPSPLPGYTVALQKCGICHSADYITLQPPNMSFEQWGKEMAKMQHTYGAPISDAEITLLAAYLASTYGDAKTVPDDTPAGPAINPNNGPIHGPASSNPSTPAVSSTLSAVQTILNANGCLGCHDMQQKKVGPAYRDVATKYQGNPAALSTVESHIRSGGQGRWGLVPMPSYPGLDAQELEMLATFVLQQH